VLSKDSCAGLCNPPPPGFQAGEELVVDEGHLSYRQGAYATAKGVAGEVKANVINAHCPSIRPPTPHMSPYHPTHIAKRRHYA
jgi:hypothetical protein